ncbi:MAG: hypothetical protein J0H18_15350 [Rhizobiales bacterium]|nr:hypothetical protein [Hyphomicrobiales bacterium]
MPILYLARFPHYMENWTPDAHARSGDKQLNGALGEIAMKARGNIQTILVLVIPAMRP